MSTTTEYDTEFDRGIEKVPFEFRTYCWNKALNAKEDHWKHFKEAITQVRFGGVSSEAEAYRLYIAEQIGNKYFFDQQFSSDEGLPQELALQLSEEIQEAFQHISRPVSASSNHEEIIVDIINYYFPSEERIQNFELALNGAFNEELNSDVNDFIESPQKTLAEIETDNQGNQDDFTLDSFDHATNKTTAKEELHQPDTQSINKVFSLANPSSTSTTERVSTAAFPSVLPNGERPKLINYLKQRDSSSAITNIPSKIKKIIDEFYPPQG